jgi:hypothetical protein
VRGVAWRPTVDGGALAFACFSLANKRVCRQDGEESRWVGLAGEESWWVRLAARVGVAAVCVGFRIFKL